MPRLVPSGNVMPHPMRLCVGQCDNAMLLEKVEIFMKRIGPESHILLGNAVMKFRVLLTYALKSNCTGLWVGGSSCEKQ